MLVALGEMALAGRTGFTLAAHEAPLAPHALYFGEDQGRYLLGVTATDAGAILERASRAGVPAQIVGEAAVTR